MMLKRRPSSQKPVTVPEPGAPPGLWRNSTFAREKSRREKGSRPMAYGAGVPKVSDEVGRS